MIPTEPFTMPLSYHYQVQSGIYRLLWQNPAYADFLHNTGYGKHEKPFRLFTFGSLQGDYRIAKKQMLVQGKISLEIRSIQPDFILILKESLVEVGVFQLFDQCLPIRMVEASDKRITDTQIFVQTASPVVAKQTLDSGKTIYFAPTDAEFLPIVQKNLCSRYEAFSGKRLENPPEIIPHGRYKKIVTQYKNFWITAYHGQFVLEGDADVLDFLYQTGLGQKNAQGFGMLDVTEKLDIGRFL